MMLTLPLRKGLLTAHVLASVGWVGALTVFLAHAIAAGTTADPRIVRAAAWAMDLAAWTAILPLAVAALATGVVQALGTPWGLFRHHWVTFKLVLTGVATAVLLAKLGPIHALAESTARTDLLPDNASGLVASLLVHAAGGLVVLVGVAVLAVYKPAGRWQSQPWPRWVRVSLAFAAVLLVALVVMAVFGEHGPAMHGR